MRAGRNGRCLVAGRSKQRTRCDGAVRTGEVCSGGLAGGGVLRAVAVVANVNVARSGRNSWRLGLARVIRAAERAGHLDLRNPRRPARRRRHHHHHHHTRTDGDRGCCSARRHDGRAPATCRQPRRRAEARQAVLAVRNGLDAVMHDANASGRAGASIGRCASNSTAPWS